MRRDEGGWKVTFRGEMSLDRIVAYILAAVYRQDVSIFVYRGDYNTHLFHLSYLLSILCVGKRFGHLTIDLFSLHHSDPI